MIGTFAESEAAIEASKTAPVLYAGRWLGNGLLARDEIDAARLISLAKSMRPSTLADRTTIGHVTPDGDVIIRKAVIDGELTVDCLRITRKPAGEWTATEKRWQRRNRMAPIAAIELLYDETPGTTSPPSRPTDEFVRDLCRYIASDPTRNVDSHDRDVHGYVCLLADRAGTLAGNPIPAATPSHTDDVVTPAGLITARSLIGPGMVVWSVADETREPDQQKDGGLIIAESYADTGRIFTVALSGTRTSIWPRHLHERDIHVPCLVRCPLCPPGSSRGEARRLFRGIHWTLAVGSGQLTGPEAVLLNAATTTLNVTL